jgi:hypothetical protein
MKVIVKLIFALTTLSMLVSCVAGHQDFVDLRNSAYLGRVMDYKAPYKFSNSGEFIRGDYVIAGDGLTRISEDKNGDLIYHFSVQEILSNTRTEKEWIGKCLIYYVADPETYIVKDWGFDEGGTPLSCRTFT